MPMPHHRITQIDAFTEEVFGGNPAGVLLDAEELSDRQMQLIAREMNVSETAFVTDAGQSNSFSVRFFTPTHEVDLCGHATVAAFWLLAREGRLQPEGERAAASQHTGAGELEVEVCFREGHPQEIMMSQVRPRCLGSPGWSTELMRILGLPADGVKRMPEPGVVSTGLAGLMVPVADRDILWSLSPDFRKLAEYCRLREIVSVHCFTFDVLDEACHVHCRDFSPAVGVPEDPATGTASGALAAYLVCNDLLPAGLQGKGNSVVRISMEQGHCLDRPSLIQTEVTVQDGRPAAVRVGGSARLVLDGTIRLR